MPPQDQSTETQDEVIVLGGNLERLVAQLRQLDERKGTLTAELASAERMIERITLSRGELAGLVQAALKNYRRLLARQVAEARAILARASGRPHGLYTEAET